MKSCYRFFLLLSITLLSCAPNAKIQYFVKNGLIDLSNYDFNKSGTITLNGFYYYKYNCFDLAINNKDMKLFRIPGYWNQKEKRGTGFALLKVNLILPDKHNLFIYQDYCSTAYELFANNSLILKSGKWGIDKKSSIPQLKSDIAQLPNSKNIELTYRISNFHSDVGGIPFSPIIGTEAQIKDIIFKRFFYDAALFGILLILGIYHFFLWIWHKKDRAALYLALSSIAIAIRILTANFFISWLFPEPSVLLYEIQLKITYFFGCFGWFIIPFFINALYEFALNKKLLLIIKFLLISFFVFLLFSPVSLFNSWLIPFQIIIVIIGLWNMISLSVAIYQKKPNASFILIGFICFFITTVNDLLYAHNIINTYNIISFGLVILIFTQAIALAKNFSNAFKQSEYLSLHLKDEVQSRTRQLEEVTRQKTDFFINLAHETKTPLSLITNYLEKYIKEHERSKDLLIIKQNIEKLKNDMVNYLDIEKIKNNQIFYDHEQICNLSRLVYDKNILFKEAALQKNINLQWNIENGLSIKADPMAIDRVLNNLLDNAIKYTDNNGYIFVSLFLEADTIKLSVADTGIGISEQQKDYIFAPYYQISHKKRNIQGLGMGLYITDMIIKQLEGCIFMESEIGEGTEFTITLKKYEIKSSDEVTTDFKPTKPADMIIINREDLKAKSFDKDKKTIFIVEDNLQLVANLKKELENEFNVYFGINGKDALEKIASLPIPPDVIISDIMMDVMDGYEFRNELIKNKIYTAIPFIFLTAKGGFDEKMQGLSQGAVDYICKPFKIDELIEKIKSWLLLLEMKKLKDNIIIQKKNHSRLENFIKDYGITKTEKTVITHLLMEKNTHEISEKMFISKNTVRKHVERIKVKLNVVKKQELMQILFEYMHK